MPPLVFRHKITDAETFLCMRRPDTETAAERMVRLHWRLYNVAPPVNELDRSVAAVVKIDAGRWLVGCPWCVGHWQYASRLDRRFFCVDCGNVEIGGRWIRADWPGSEQEIEAVLLERLMPETRHWLPGETPDDLREQNLMHGDGIAA